MSASSPRQKKGSPNRSVVDPRTGALDLGGLALPVEATGDAGVLGASEPKSDVTGVVGAAGVSTSTGFTASRSWRARAQQAVAADSAPSWSLDLRSVQDDVEDRRSRAVMDLAMRVAELTLATGASAADVTATVLRLTDAYGLRSVHVDVTFTAIAVSHHRGSEDPVTMVRTVRVRSVDYERLARLQAFVSDISTNPVDVVDARSRFDAIAARPHIYRRSVVTAGSAVLGAAVALLLNGSFAEVVIAFVNALVVDRMLLWASRARLASFFSQMLGGAVPTAFALLLIVGRSHQVPGLAEVSPSAVVAAGIVSLLAGMSVVGAAQDAIDGYYVTASARTYEVIVLTLGIIVGVLLALGIGQRLGVPSYLAPYSTLNGNLTVQLVACALIAAGFAVSSYAGPVTALVSVACGVFGWFVYATALGLGFGPVPASGAAALFIGVVSQLAAGTVHVPSLALSTAGIVPLLPGGSVYRGLYQLTQFTNLQGVAPGLLTLGEAGGIGLALAAGVSLGTYFGRPMRPDVARSRSRATQRALRRAHADGRE